MQELNYWVPLSGTTDLALLPCGATIHRLQDGDTMAILSCYGPFTPDRNALREGDSIVFCPKDCISMSRCPLVKKYMEALTGDELESFAKSLVDKFKPRHGHGDLADVRDCDGQDDAAPVRLRGIYIYLDGEPHLVVAPMVEVVHEGDKSRQGGDGAGDGHDSPAPGVEESKKGIRAGNVTTTAL